MDIVDIITRRQVITTTESMSHWISLPNTYRYDSETPTGTVLVCPLVRFSKHTVIFLEFTLIRSRMPNSTLLECTPVHRYTPPEPKLVDVASLQKATLLANTYFRTAKIVLMRFFD